MLKDLNPMIPPPPPPLPLFFNFILFLLSSPCSDCKTFPFVFFNSNGEKGNDVACSSLCFFFILKPVAEPVLWGAIQTPPPPHPKTQKKKINFL